MLRFSYRLIVHWLMNDSRILYLDVISGISSKKDVDTGQLF